MYVDCMMVTPTESYATSHVNICHQCAFHCIVVNDETKEESSFSYTVFGLGASLTLISASFHSLFLLVG